MTMNDDTLDAVRALGALVQPASQEQIDRQRQAFEVWVSQERLTLTHAARPRRRRRRTLRALTLVVVCGAVGGTGAVAAALLDSNEQRAATIDAHYSQFGPFSGPGSGLIEGARPTLDAEKVLCDYRFADVTPTHGFGPISYSYASDERMTVPLTSAIAVRACVGGNDAIRGEPIAASAPSVVCEVIDGQSNIGPGSPVVLFGSESCGHAGYATARPDLFDRVNRQREIEAAIDAVPQACPTPRQALDWVKEQIRSYDLQLRLMFADTPGGVCYLPHVHWWTEHGNYVDISPTYFPDN